jgi:hypothetical protein
MTTPRGEMINTFHFEGTGSAMKGSIKNERRPEPAELSALQLNGKVLTCKMVRETPNGSMEVLYKLTFSDDGKSFEGTMAFGDRGEMPIKGKKK